VLFVAPSRFPLLLSDGHPIPNLIEQAKALLVTYQTSMPQPSSFSDTKAREAEERKLVEDAAAKAAAAAAKAEQMKAAPVEEVKQESNDDPDEDPEMRELRLMVEEQMRNK
jgi:hypothetical protein